MTPASNRGLVVAPQLTQLNNGTIRADQILNMLLTLQQEMAELRNMLQPLSQVPAQQLANLMPLCNSLFNNRWFPMF